MKHPARKRKDRLAAYELELCKAISEMLQSQKAKMESSRSQLIEEIKRRWNQ